MGYPIRVSPEITAELKSMVESIIARGRIPDGDEREDVDAALVGLGEGFDINVRVLLGAISEYGTIHQKNRAEELAESIDGLKQASRKFSKSYRDYWQFEPEKLGISGAFAQMFPAGGMFASGIAIDRANGIADPLHHDPSELIPYLFEPFGSFAAARETLVSDERETAFDWVQSALGMSIAKQIADAIRVADDELRIPPTPSSPEFYRTMKDELDLDASTYAGWVGTESWRLALAYLFAELLIKGTVATDSNIDRAIRERSYIRIKEESIAQKTLWAASLLDNFFDIEFLERAVMERFNKGSLERTYALAELSRYRRLPTQRPWEYDNAAEAFLASMIAVHRMAPGVEGDAFMKLVSPLVKPMSFEGAKILLGNLKEDRSGFRRFKGLNIFGWHTGDPERTALWLAKIISQNKKFATLEEFLSNMLDVTVGAFAAKAGSMRRAGVDVEPLVSAVKDSFPEDAKLFAGTMMTKSPQERQDVTGSRFAPTTHTDMRVKGAVTATTGAQLVLPLFNGGAKPVL